MGRREPPPLALRGRHPDLEGAPRCRGQITVGRERAGQELLPASGARRRAPGGEVRLDFLKARENHGPQVIPSSPSFRTSIVAWPRALLPQGDHFQSRRSSFVCSGLQVM